MKEISVYKTTSDNWCGSYEIHEWPMVVSEYFSSFEAAELAEIQVEAEYAI